MSKILILIFSSVAVFVAASGYNPETEIAKRVENFRKTCQKYNDDLTYEYHGLFGTHDEPGAKYYNHRRKFGVCVPPKTSANSWIVMMKTLAFHDMQLYPEENHWPNVTKDDIRHTYHKSIVVRPPLERVLSVYRFALRDTTILPDVNKRALEYWLANREDKLTPEPDEAVVDDRENPIMTWRQFVNFLIKCPKETPECALWANEGVAYHWGPFWALCSNPCYYGLDSIVYMSTMEDDKRYLFDKLGLDNEVPLTHQNPTGGGHSSNKETVKKFFSKLLKSEIYELYLRYKLDHELFGFSPDEYIAMGRDSIDQP